jgi:hypothetical protein
MILFLYELILYVPPISKSASDKKLLAFGIPPPDLKSEVTQSFPDLRVFK